MKNTFYLGGIVIGYWLIKEEIFDGGDEKYMPGWSLQIPRSGSVPKYIITFRRVKIFNLSYQKRYPV